MIIDITQTRIETSIKKSTELDNVFQFVIQLVNACTLPAPAMFEERGWDYHKYIHKMRRIV